MKIVQASRWIVFALAAASFAVPARAEAVTLICSAPDSSMVPPRPHTYTIGIDLSGHRVCMLPSVTRPPCTNWTHATITERTITFSYNSSEPPITIDRLTGNVIYPDGASGTCQRAGKPVL
ncbi:MAG: hypothetical protein KGJ66_03110 [Alphaproteobacteria bacterium]|nr:hypothetical protein [Alphaproteobacteria bacterium]